MKKILLTLVFVLGAMAQAEQQPQPPVQPEIVDFDACFNVLVCTLKNPQQLRPSDMKDLECDTTEIKTEKMSVALEPSREHEGLLVGKLELNSEANGFKHMGKVVVAKDMTKQVKNYGFMVEESFFKSDEEQPHELDRTYGAVRVNLPAELNDIAFIGKIMLVEDKFYIPVLGIAAAGSTPQMIIKNFKPSLF